MHGCHGSRLPLLAKEHAERLLASGETVVAAGEPEAARWSLDGETVLRGRLCPTRPAIPVARSAVAPA